VSHTLDLRGQIHARTSRPDYFDWLAHVTPAGECAHPIRLAGFIEHVGATSSLLLGTVHTADMPDGVIYKPCGNRRAHVCPSCARTYQRDAYQVLRAGLVGGKGVPGERATHPATFTTFTAPGFGPVHSRNVQRHTCTNRRRCDCRPEPCHARRAADTCPHGQVLACYARHSLDDPRLGTPLCLDCYDYPHQAVWNNQASELWRRTTMAMTRHIRRTAARRGIHPKRVKLSFGKVAELQRRGVVHFHAIIRLDGQTVISVDDEDQVVTTTPPAELTIDDLIAAVEWAARTTGFTTATHPAQPCGWSVAWGEKGFDQRVINAGTDGEITDSMAAGYLAKYATKSTEITGHISRRLDGSTVEIYAKTDGTHPERLLDACWTLGAPLAWRGLRRWTHMLGFGGHFLTKSRAYSITFRLLREARVIWRRTHTTGPETDADQLGDETVIVDNFLQFVGSGWHTTGDAILAATAADMARRRREAAREAATHALAA
jgi:hypothetical protein